MCRLYSELATIFFGNFYSLNGTYVTHVRENTYHITWDIVVEVLGIPNEGISFDSQEAKKSLNILSWNYQNLTYHLQ